MSAQNPKANPSDQTEKPRTWWQWILVHPTLVIPLVGGLGGSIPTAIEFIQSVRYDVPFGQSAYARDQAEAWKRNMSCTTAPLEPLITPKKVEVDATICRTGDVLVRIKTPDGLGVFRWVNLDTALSNTLVAALSAIVPSAMAGNLNREFSEPSGKYSVECQFPTSNRRVVRISRRENGFCEAAEIDTYNGNIVSRTVEIPRDQCTEICVRGAIDFDRYQTLRRSNQ